MAGIEVISADLGKLGDILDRSPIAMFGKARAAVKKGAQNVKTDAQARVKGIAHAPNYGRTITYDVQQSASSVWALIGPDKAKEVGGGPSRTPGNLGGVIEFGSPKSAPIPHMRPAGEAEEPRFLKAIGDAASAVLEGR